MYIKVHDKVIFTCIYLIILVLIILCVVLYLVIHAFTFMHIVKMLNPNSLENC